MVVVAAGETRANLLQQEDELRTIPRQADSRNCQPVKGSFPVIADFESKKCCTFDEKDNEMGCVETQGRGDIFWKSTLGNENAPRGPSRGIDGVSVAESWMMVVANQAGLSR